MDWTKERRLQLESLWLTGMSASQIATEMGGGLTKNAVIGKAHRLGLSKKDKKSKPVEKSKQTPRKPKVKKVNPSWVERTPIVPDHIPPAAGPVGGLPLADLSDSKCHAIVGVLALPNGSSEPAYCGGDKVHGKIWCSHHHARYSQPARNR